jgi:ATP-dependent DNA helicase RecG
VVEEVDIDYSQIDALKERQEGHFFDFKSKRITPAKLTRSVSAFANADGGELYVGIEDPKNGWNWTGFDEKENANGLLQAISGLFPLGDGVHSHFFLLVLRRATFLE